MDDGRRENNKIKRSKSESVKSIVSFYLKKRQFSKASPKKTSKKLAVKRALLDNSISKCNSILYSNFISSDPLVIEYSFMFEKFVNWLEDQTQHKQQCCDIEKLVGPLFCHLYFNIQNNGQFDKANTFFKKHFEKVDNSKCDDTVNNMLKAISKSIDISVMNGTDNLNLDELKEKFRSNKIVIEITPESLNLLKKFVAESCHIVILHALETWFDLRITNNKIMCVKLNNVTNIPQDFDIKKISSKEYLEEQKTKLQSVIQAVKQLPSSICNVGIFNSKHIISCGLMRRQAGLIAFAENNTLIVMPLKALDSLYSYENLEHVKFNNHSKRIYCVTLSPNNQFICTGSADHTICIYSLTKLKILKRLWGHLGPVYCISICNNSKYIVSGSHDTTARLWSLKSGNVLRVFAGHTDIITSVHFHPNSLYVATGSADKNLRMWCVKTAQPVRLLQAGKKEVYTVAFSPNGQYLACASDDKSVRIWDISTAKVLHEFKNKDSSVIHLCWRSDDNHLCGATLSGIVKVWDIAYYLKNKDKEKNKEPVLWKIINGRILSLEYSVGTWACVSIRKPGYSPLDNVFEMYK